MRATRLKRNVNLTQSTMLQVLDLEVHPMLPVEAEAISHWRYAGRYAVYDGSVGRESESAQYMLDPRHAFHSVRGPSGLIGFCSYGIDGRVPGGTYGDHALDVGAGMDPNLVGNGHGRVFLSAVVDYATRELNAGQLRATIASWNERALRAWRSIGFRPISTFQADELSEFTILVRGASRATRR